MYLSNFVANLAIISVIILLTTSLSNASTPIKHITDPKQNYTISGDNVILHSLVGDIKIPMPDAKQNYKISGDNVILHSLVGDIKIPMPDEVKTALREQNNKTKKRRVSRQAPYYQNRNINYNFGFGFPDFFECNEQAQIALSPYSENHRYWEAFFKRNSVNNTIAVRYCCNLLDYVENAEMQLSPECRDQVRLQDHVMIRPEIRYVCREYEQYNIQCFLVRWMYWWIPFILLILIALGIFFGCSAVRRRSNKSQLNEDIKSLKESKYDDHNSNTLPYRPAYTTPVYGSPLKSSATNKAFMHN